MYTKWNSEPPPISRLVVIVAVTELTKRGTRELIVRSSISTSSVKTNPANGALNMAAIPADAPHPTIRITDLESIRKKRPRLDPMAAPVITMGASAPTDPPKPMVILLATMELQVL